MDIDAGKLLTEALNLVKSDLAHIAKLSLKGKLKHNDAQDLAKYATLLHGIKEADTDRDADQEKRARRALAGMTTEELIQKYQEFKGATNGKPQGA